MQPIRILHIVGAMNHGGAEVLLMELCRTIDRTKFQFDFLIHSQEKGNFDDEILALGGKIYYLKNRFYRNVVKYLHELYTFFRMHTEYECIHVHMNSMSGYILWMAKRACIRVRIVHSHVTNPRIDILRRIVWWLGRKLISHNANVMLGCSADAIRYLSGAAPDNIHRIVMKNAINIQRFAFDKALRDSVRKNLSADEDTLIIGNVARFEEPKNHHFILSVFEELLVNKTNALLILIGYGSLFSEIQEEAKKMNIESRVKFLGVRSDVNEILNAMDVFLLPSLYEGLGIVLIEAQANGLPCVASDTIPRVADINAGLISFISLKNNEKTWCKFILEAKRTKSKDDPQVSAKISGYDISEIAAWIQSFYLNKIRSVGIKNEAELPKHNIAVSWDKKEVH